jgi:hypothetical protein
MPGTYSPLLLTAAKGLVNNEGLKINSTLVSNISSYKNTKLISMFNSIIESAIGKEHIQYPEEHMFDSKYEVVVAPSPNFYLYTFAAGTAPEFADTIPEGYDYIVTAQEGLGSMEDGMTQRVINQANDILGNGDLSKFTIHMNTITSVKDASAQYIDAAEGSDTYVEPTYDDMDSLTTGSITKITKATADFGKDLEALGKLIDFNNIEILGSPLGILQVFVDQGLLPLINPELETVSVSAGAINEKIELQETISPIIQKRFYQALQLVVGSKLKTLTTVLKIKTPNLTSAADLLDLTKLFPVSYKTITSPDDNGEVKNIFDPQTGGIRAEFSGVGKELYAVVPQSIADSNVAFRNSLQQVRGIQEVNPAFFATTCQNLQTNLGLDLINNQTQAIPNDVKHFFETEFAKGSGPKGRYYLADGIGTPAGHVHNDQLQKTIQVINDLDYRDKLDDLYNCYQIMLDFLNDEFGTPSPGNVLGGVPPLEEGQESYDGTPYEPVSYAVIPVGLPGAGYYNTYNDGIVQIGIATLKVMKDIVDENIWRDEKTPFMYMAEQIERELNMAAEGGIIYKETPTSKTSLLMFVNNIHAYGRKDEKLGAAEMLEKIADLSIRTGEAIVASLREGRNLAQLESSGIGTDSVPEPVSPNEPGEQLPSQYSASDLTG